VAQTFATWVLADGAQNSRLALNTRRAVQLAAGLA